MRFLILFLAGVAAPLAAAEYAFTVNGEARNLKILPVRSDRKGDAGPGDVAFIDGTPFVLGAPGRYHLSISPDGGPVISIDPSGAKMLRGFAARGSVPTLPGSARWHDTALHLELDTPRLPVLPGTLRYLSLRFAKPPAAPDLDPLANLAHLLYLSVEAPAGGAIPLTVLRNAPDLRNLSIEGGAVRGPGALANLERLRFLKLRSLDGLASVDFARALPELRVLKIDGTAVTDLRPLEGARNLRLLSANRTPVASLPDLATVPALRDLRLHSTPVSKNKALMTPLRSRTSILVRNWDPAIKGFEQHDAAHPPPENPILFIGSSSVRMWDLQASFPG
ncbi:MAG: hypothetical protein HKO57_16300, partial [Akkermansiaceae bacterium]|nr:hypothetical protein [Akkermansiaceae bacterium]